jgi:hypothetical protein
MNVRRGKSPLDQLLSPNERQGDDCYERVKAALQQRQLMMNSYRAASEELGAFGKTDRWLHDVEIERCLCLLMRTQQSLWKVLSTMPCTMLVDMMKLDGELFMNTVSKGYSLAIMNTTESVFDHHYHWVVLFVDSFSRTATIIDPKTAKSSAGCSEQITALFDGYLDVRTMGLGCQKDGYNCGVYCLSIVEKLVQSDGDVSFDDIDIATDRERWSNVLYSTFTRT